MAITILPLYFTVPLLIYFGVILAIVIDSLVKAIKLWKLKKIGSRDLIIGLIISLTLFGFMYSLYPEEKSSLSIIFVGPLLTIFLPYLLHVVAYNSKKENYVSKFSVIIIVFSMIGVFLRPIISNLLESMLK
jgi:hypothetical protein